MPSLNSLTKKELIERLEESEARLASPRTIVADADPEARAIDKIYKALFQLVGDYTSNERDWKDRYKVPRSRKIEWREQAVTRVLSAVADRFGAQLYPYGYRDQGDDDA